MGCSSSKQTETRPTKRVSPVVANNVPPRRLSNTKSADSGISSAEEATEPDKNEDHSCVRDKTDKYSHGKRKSAAKHKGGVAFYVPNSSASIIKSHPPLRLLSQLEIAKTKSSSLDPVARKEEDHEKMRQFVQKQVHAEQLREQERHAVVARQKRRSERAKTVQEKKKRLLEETENWGDDDISDIDCDQNFNAEEEYDLWSSDGSDKLERKSSIGKEDLSKEESSDDDGDDTQEYDNDTESQSEDSYSESELKS